MPLNVCYDMFPLSGFVFCFLLSWSGLHRHVPITPLSAQTSSPLNAPSSKSSGEEGNGIPVQLPRLRSNVSSFGVDLKSISPALHVSAKTGRIGANLGYFYLQKELKLSEHHMVKIMEKIIVGMIIIIV